MFSSCIMSTAIMVHHLLLATGILTYKRCIFKAQLVSRKVTREI